MSTPTIQQPAQPKAKKPKTYRSGHCVNGQHEGTKPKNYRGVPLPTCMCTSAECACMCHKQFDEFHQIKIEMGKAAEDEPREIVNLSEYQPAPSRFVLPDPLTLMAERAERRAASQRTGDPNAVTVGRHTFAPTPTGMRAPQQLEYMVLETLRAWLDPQFEWLEATPKRVAGVMEDKGMGVVSTGAIHAVFVRWREMGFCKFQNRPAVFQGFVNEGTAEELDVLKKKYKRPPAQRRWQKENK